MYLFICELGTCFEIYIGYSILLLLHENPLHIGVFENQFKY